MSFVCMIIFVNMNMSVIQNVLLENRELVLYMIKDSNATNCMFCFV